MVCASLTVEAPAKAVIRDVKIYNKTKGDYSYNPANVPVEPGDEIRISATVDYGATQYFSPYADPTVFEYVAKIRDCLLDYPSQIVWADYKCRLDVAASGYYKFGIEIAPRLDKCPEAVGEGDVFYDYVYVEVPVAVPDIRVESITLDKSVQLVGEYNRAVVAMRNYGTAAGYATLVITQDAVEIERVQVWLDAGAFKEYTKTWYPDVAGTFSVCAKVE